MKDDSSIESEDENIGNSPPMQTNRLNINESNNSKSKRSLTLNAKNGSTLKSG